MANITTTSMDQVMLRPIVANSDPMIEQQIRTVLHNTMFQEDTVNNAILQEDPVNNGTRSTVQ